MPPDLRVRPNYHCDQSCREPFRSRVAGRAWHDPAAGPREGCPRPAAWSGTAGQQKRHLKLPCRAICMLEHSRKPRRTLHMYTPVRSQLQSYTKLTSSPTDVAAVVVVDFANEEACARAGSHHSRPGHSTPFHPADEAWINSLASPIPGQGNTYVATHCAIATRRYPMPFRIATKIDKRCDSGKNRARRDQKTEAKLQCE
jgi:hypothetical protein